MLRHGEFNADGAYVLNGYSDVYLDSSIYENIKMMTTAPYVTRDGEELRCMLYKTGREYAIGYTLRDTFRFKDTEVYWDLDYVYATDNVKERRERIIHFIKLDMMSSVESALYVVENYEIYSIVISLKEAVGARGYFTEISFDFPVVSSMSDGYMFINYAETYLEAKNFAFDVYYEIGKVRKTRLWISDMLMDYERAGHVSYFSDNPYFKELDYYGKI